ncbi:hypothetical protein JCM10908_000963 [Rhodotorula pacifica]|uniref:uncharacterized protein n=1 Tax=Rhodotorula pacifica TaxID=1495444 RepID=UPI003178ECFE
MHNATPNAHEPASSRQRLNWPIVPVNLLDDGATRRVFVVRVLHCQHLAAERANRPGFGAGWAAIVIARLLPYFEKQPGPQTRLADQRKQILWLLEDALEDLEGVDIEEEDGVVEVSKVLYDSSPYRWNFEVGSTESVVPVTLWDHAPAIHDLKSRSLRELQALSLGLRMELVGVTEHMRDELPPLDDLDRTLYQAFAGWMSTAFDRPEPAAGYASKHTTTSGALASAREDVRMVLRVLDTVSRVAKPRSYGPLLLYIMKSLPVNLDLARQHKAIGDEWIPAYLLVMSSHPPEWVRDMGRKLQDLPAPRFLHSDRGPPPSP